MTGIVHVMLDDAGYGDLAVYGHPEVNTPRCDALAAAGTRMTRFYVGSPVCSVSRACFASGRHGHEMGMRWVDQSNQGRFEWFPQHTPTIASVLQAHGWKTGFVGKWHLGWPGRGQTSGRPRGALPMAYGLDYFFGTLWGVPNTPSSPKYLDGNWIETVDGVETDVGVVNGFATDTTFSRAISWMQANVSSGVDWYLQAHPHVPHSPLDATISEADNYTGTTAEKTYWGSMENFDTNLGALLDELTSLGVDDETFVFVTSDNGPEDPALGTNIAGSAGSLKDGKGTLYEGGLRVPGIWWGPGVPVDVDSTIRWAIDWLPTCMDIAGIEMPNLPHAYEGTSFRSTPPARKLRWIMHYPDGVTTKYSSAQYQWAELDTATDLKLYRTSEDGTGDVLYDIGTDEEETTDVSGDNSAAFAAMRASLTAWAEDLPEHHADHIGDAENPADQTAVPTVIEEPVVYVLCHSAADRTAKIALLDKMLGLSSASVSRLPGASGGHVSHPTLKGTPSLAVSKAFRDAAADETYRANLSASELAQLDEMLLWAGGAPVP